jgi:hypothetical protein
MSQRPRSFFVFPSGNSFPVDDPVAFCREHVGHPLLDNARQRLLRCDTRTDPDRVLNVVLRRCGLKLAVVSPGRVVVHHWTQPADLRPFLKEHRLARPDVEVALVRRKSGLVTLQPGDHFLYGSRLAPGFPWDAYRERWERRQDHDPTDRAPAPESQSSYSWEGVEPGRIPWAALKSVWRRERAPDCPNCDVSLATWSFDERRSGWLSGTRAVIAHCCFLCRRGVEEECQGDLWPWLLKVLDADVLPARHDGGFGVTDLRPRWPAPPARNLYDLDNLPHDLTLDELVRILM